jgi:4-diphosphocytidyl-2-C-methyl-D-erythritol kinase
MPSVAVLAPAKINLALHVTGRRDDGYHEIETLAVFAETGDRIVARLADADSFSLSGPFADALEGHANLVLGALEALRQATGQAGQVGLHLEKDLPVASGIGGGSADAAAALLALKALWGLPQDFSLAEIARKLGADVPMCLASRPLLARGVGEHITPVELPAALHAVLVNPGVAVPTRAVFGLLERADNAPVERLPTAGFDMAWLKRQRNDLQPPAIAAYPVIGEVLALLDRCGGALLARMSGSGATCFALFGTREEAGAAALAVGRQWPAWWCVATRLLPGEYAGRLTMEA